MKRRFVIAVISSALLLTSVSFPASAQGTAGDYPNRPIRIIVPQAAGSGIDLQARLLAQKLSQAWGQAIVVDNRPGANAIIGMEAGAKAPPDGYTLTYVPVSALTINPFLYKSLPYGLQDFAPITQTVINPLGAVASPASGLKSLHDIVAQAKANPGRPYFGSFGIGNLTHLMGVLFATTAKIEMTHVPYKGQTPEIADIMSGQLQLGFTTISGAGDQIASGQIKLLATFGELRDELFPDVPTPTELGYTGVVMVGWAGLLAPAGTPAPVIAKLHADVTKALNLPAVKDAIQKQGSRVTISETPDAFTRFIKAEQEKFQPVVKAAGLEGSQ